MYFTKLRKGEKVSNAVLPRPGLNVPLKERKTEIEILVFAHKKPKAQTCSDHIWHDFDSEHLHFHPVVTLMYIHEPLKGEPRHVRAADIHSTGSFSV